MNINSLYYCKRYKYFPLNVSVSSKNSRVIKGFVCDKTAVGNGDYWYACNNGGSKNIFQSYRRAGCCFYFFSAASDQYESAFL